MTKTIDEHLQEVKQKGERVSDLKKSIAQNESLLTKKEAEYKEAVINDSSDIDNLYHEIESLKKKLQADRHKVKTLEEVTEEYLRESAYDVLLTFPTVVKPFAADVKGVQSEIKKEVERHEKAMRGLRGKGEEINARYEDEAYRYLELTGQHGIIGHIKNEYGINSPEINKKLELERERAAAEHKLLPPRLYNSIEAAAEGRSRPFKMKLQ